MLTRVRIFFRDLIFFFSTGPVRYPDLGSQFAKIGRGDKNRKSGQNLQYSLWNEIRAKMRTRHRTIKSRTQNLVHIPCEDVAGTTIVEIPVL